MCAQQYISDIVGDDYKHWELGKTTIINTPTGSGKTHFILNKLLPYAASINEKILYLSNRSALRDQVNNSYDKNLLESISSLTYQKFVNSPFDQESRSSIYWVMDEAHYFLNDSQFNGNLLKCFEHIKKTKENHVFLFLTATPAYLLLTLYAKQFFTIRGALPQIESIHRFTRNDKSICFSGENLAARDDPDYFKNKFDEYQSLSFPQGNCTHYHVPNDYSYINPFYYYDPKDLLKQIAETPDDEQWLVFVPTIAKGEELCHACHNLGIQDAVFIQASTKKEKHSPECLALNNIIKESYTPNRVIIATKVLDNGVSLIDPTNVQSPQRHLKHVVIQSLNQTEFIQMLGRKRVREGETVNLYLQAKSVSRIFSFANRTIFRHLRFLLDLKYQKRYYSSEDVEQTTLYRASTSASFREFQDDYLISDTYKSPFRHYIQPAAHSIKSNSLNENNIKTNFDIVDIFVLNPITTTKLTYDYFSMLSFLEWAVRKEPYANDQDLIQLPTAWLTNQLSWLGLEYDPSRWLSYAAQNQGRDEFRSILKFYSQEHSSHSPMTEEQEQAFKQSFLNFVSSNYPASKVAKSKASISTINKVLCDLDLPFHVVSKKKALNGIQRHWLYVETQS